MNAPSVDRMTDVDSLMWTLERDPRLRSPITVAAIFDGPLDAGAVRHRIDRASRRIRRLRQRVVADPYGIAPPMWEIDPDFSLSFHLRTTDLDGAGDDALMALAEDITMQPFDRARPLWEFTLVSGLDGDRSAMVMKTHHAVTDGVGGVELSLEIFDLAPTPDPERDELPPAPEPAPPTESSRLTAAFAHEAQAAIGSARRVLDILVGASADPVASAQLIGATAGSANRMLRPTPDPLSPLMTGRSSRVGFDAVQVPLADLKAAGKRIDGSINDAFVSGVLLGLRSYHAAHGHHPDALRMAVPINRRKQGDDTPGNNWAPSRADMPVQVTDPDELMRRVRGTITRLRHEPAHDLLEPAARLIRRAPAPVAANLFASMAGGIDVAASNVPGSPIPVFLLGRHVDALLPFGPLSGSASNVTLLSTADTANIGIVRDRGAVDDGESFGRHLRDGLDTVIAGA